MFGSGTPEYWSLFPPARAREPWAGLPRAIFPLLRSAAVLPAGGARWTAPGDAVVVPSDDPAVASGVAAAVAAEDASVVIVPPGPAAALLAAGVVGGALNPPFVRSRCVRARIGRMRAPGRPVCAFALRVAPVGALPGLECPAV